MAWSPLDFLGGAGLLNSLIPKLDPNSETPVADWLVGTPFNDRFAPATANPLQPYSPPTRNTAVPDVLRPQGDVSMGQYGGINYPIFGSPPENVDMSAAGRSRQGGGATPPVQFQAPAQQAEPSFLDRMAAFGNNLAQSPSLLGGIAGAIQGAQTGMSSEQQNQINRYKAIYPALARQPNIGPERAHAIALAVAQDPSGKAMEHLLNPAMGFDIKTPQGVIARQMQGFNATGTPQGNAAALGALKQLNAAEAEGTESGKLRATAVQAEAGGIQQARDAAAIAQRLLSHEGRNNSLFFHSLPAGALSDEQAVKLSGGTQAGDAIALMNQLKSQAFLETYQNVLKGGGQISNIEGAKGTAAINRFTRATTKAEGDQALKEFIQHTQRAIDNFQFKAGNAPPNYEGSIAVKSGNYDYVPGRGLVPRQ